MTHNSGGRQSRFQRKQEEGESQSLNSETKICSHQLPPKITDLFSVDFHSFVFLEESSVIYYFLF